MQVSVEISYYPLNEKFADSIHAFIANLKSYQNIIVQPNGISTQVFGEYREVMGILTNEIEKASELPHSIFVLKIINADRNKMPVKS
ncbi:MAG: hypothetical protein Q8880_04540 [Bacteroidota bacterium]|nr:hypothetical protein [Bacteroidota bacterium]